MKHRGFVVATQADVRDLIDRLIEAEEAVRASRAAATTGDLRVERVIAAARRVMDDLDNLRDVRARTGLELGAALDDLSPPGSSAAACPATATGNPVDCGGCPEHADAGPAAREDGAPDDDCTCIAPHPACPNCNGTGKVTP